MAEPSNWGRSPSNAPLAAAGAGAGVAGMAGRAGFAQTVVMDGVMNGRENQVRCTKMCEKR